MRFIVLLVQCKKKKSRRGRKNTIWQQTWQWPCPVPTSTSSVFDWRRDMVNREAEKAPTSSLVSVHTSWVWAATRDARCVQQVDGKCDVGAISCTFNSNYHFYTCEHVWTLMTCWGSPQLCFEVFCSSPLICLLHHGERAESGNALTWLILPVVICLSQRLSHACLSISFQMVKLRMAH